MGDQFDDFLKELADQSKKVKKNELEFEVFQGTDIGIASHVPYGIPTRIPQLDLSIGKPGYPAGRIVEIYGFEMSGKTTAALAAMAAAQRKGGYCMWIDAEHAWDPAWARKNGVDPEKVVVAEADSVEGILSVCSRGLEARAKMDPDTPFIMVTDSITAVPSQESLEKDFGEVDRVGTDAKAIRKGMRKLCKDIAEAKALAIFINHSTSKIATTAFAKQSQSAGGHALKFWSSLRIEFARTGNVTEGTGAERVREGMRVGMTVEKNKVAKTGKMKVECNLLDTGFDLYDNLFDAMIDIEEIEKVNQQTYFFKPTGTQLSRKEWRTFVEEHAEGVDETYNWFLKKAMEKGYITPY